jgi:threonine aldolase
MLLEHLAARGILATGLIGLRFVTHLDVDAAGIDRTLAAVREFFALPVGAHARATTAAAPY